VYFISATCLDLRGDHLQALHFAENVRGHTRFVQNVSGLTTVHEVDKAYGVLTLIFFNIVPVRSYTLRPKFLPLLETFCELFFRDV